MAELKINQEYIVKINAEVETDLTNEEIKDLISTLPEVLADVITDEITDGVGTVDVEPVKRGEWISMLVKRLDWKGNMQSYYQPNTCSECHIGLIEKTNYCPNCGAKMDGKGV